MKGRLLKKILYFSTSSSFFLRTSITSMLQKHSYLLENGNSCRQVFCEIDVLHLQKTSLRNNAKYFSLSTVASWRPATSLKWTNWRIFSNDFDQLKGQNSNVVEKLLYSQKMSRKKKSCSEKGEQNLTRLAWHFLGVNFCFFRICCCCCCCFLE